MKYIRIIVSAASIPIYFYIFLYLLYDWVVAAFIFGAIFIGPRLMDVLEQIVLFFLSVVAGFLTYALFGVVRWISEWCLVKWRTRSRPRWLNVSGG